MNRGPIIRIAAIPIRPVRFFEVCSHTPWTVLPPSGRGRAVRDTELPGACISLSTTVSVTELGCDQSCARWPRPRLGRQRRPAVRPVGGEIGHQLDDLLRRSRCHEVEVESVTHAVNVSAAPTPQCCTRSSNVLDGAPGRIRTCGLLLRRQTLYPLSYGGALNINTAPSGPDRLAHPGGRFVTAMDSGRRSANQ
jgi:hypothetical protein